MFLHLLFSYDIRFDPSLEVKLSLDVSNVLPDYYM